METITINGKEYTRKRIQNRIERIKEERKEIQNARDTICIFAPTNKHTKSTDDLLSDAYHKLGDDLKKLQSLLTNQ
jgi:hypothetical protein